MCVGRARWNPRSGDRTFSVQRGDARAPGSRRERADHLAEEVVVVRRALFAALRFDVGWRSGLFAVENGVRDDERSGRT